MYTILCKNRENVQQVINILAEHGVQFNVIEDPSVERWSVLPASESRTLTSTSQVRAFLTESRKMVLHD